MFQFDRKEFNTGKFFFSFDLNIEKVGTFFMFSSIEFQVLAPAKLMLNFP